MTYCADPVVAAGFVTCAACAQRSYPADAAWLGAQLVLVTFENGHALRCPGRRDGGRTVLLDLASEDDTIPDAPRLPAWCTATTTAGELCQFKAKAGTDLCGVHLAKQRAARSRGTA